MAAPWRQRPGGRAPRPDALKRGPRPGAKAVAHLRAAPGRHAIFGLLLWTILGLLKILNKF